MIRLPAPGFEYEFECDALRIAAPAERLYGSLFDLRERSNSSWSVVGRGGVVGALLLGGGASGGLVVAVGEGGGGWVIDSAGARELIFEAAMPEELRWRGPEPEPEVGHRGVRRALLRELRWARVEPEPGLRVVLVDGFTTAQLGALTLDAGAPVCLERLRSAPRARGMWRRLLGGREEPGGAALTLRCVASKPLPGGFAPWLRALEERRMSLDWMGNEGDNYPLNLFESAGVHDGEQVQAELLRIARDELERHSEDAWADWDHGLAPAEGFCELVPGQPERGWWREAEWAEIATYVSLRAVEYREGGTPASWLLSEAHGSGTDIIERLRAETRESRAVAVFDVPHDDSVVAWYLFGGISKGGGERLEAVALERVWS